MECTHGGNVDVDIDSQFNDEGAGVIDEPSTGKSIKSQQLSDEESDNNESVPGLQRKSKRRQQISKISSHQMYAGLTHEPKNRRRKRRRARPLQQIDEQTKNRGIGSSTSSAFNSDHDDNESLDPKVDEGTRADEQESTVSSEQEISETSQEIIASENMTLEQRGQELIASERQILENTKARFASNGNFVGMDTKMYHLVAYRIEHILDNPSQFSRNIRSTTCSFLQAIEGNFDLEQLVKNIASNVEASALADINGQTSIGLLCLKLERATDTINRRQLPDSDAAAERLEKLKKEFPLLEGKKDLMSVLNVIRGDHGSNYQRREGTNFIVNICHITMCTDVMQQISMKVLFDLHKADNFQKQSVQLYHRMNPNQQFNSNISVLEMAMVIDRAFGHAFCSKDNTLTNQAVCVFEDIRNIMKKRGNEIFAVCDKVGDLNIDGTSSGNSENYFIGTGNREYYRRTAIVNVGTFLFLRNYLQFDQFVHLLLLLPQVAFEKRLNKLFDFKLSVTEENDGNAMPMTKEYTMIKRDLFASELLEGVGNPGKPVFAENAKQLEAYERLIYN